MFAVMICQIQSIFIKSAGARERSDLKATSVLATKRVNHSVRRKEELLPPRHLAPLEDREASQKAQT
jgi:hypothetical protein